MKTFACVVPQAVYDEVVVKGKARLHGDAEAIEAVLRESNNAAVMTQPRHEELETGLGAGERGILDLLPTEQDCVVVSDDRRFLTVLKNRGVRFLTPADVLVVMRRRAVLNQPEASQALDRLRPWIRAAAYWEARQDLEPRDDLERGEESDG